MIRRTVLLAASLAALLTQAACVVHVMDAELVSMTTKTPPKGKIKKGKEIKEEWCLGDKTAKKELDDRYGLMDQVILEAQKKHDAQYFADASFFMKGNCMTMQGSIVK